MLEKKNSYSYDMINPFFINLLIDCVIHLLELNLEHIYVSLLCVCVETAFSTHLTFLRVD